VARGQNVNLVPGKNFVERRRSARGSFLEIKKRGQ
jgi:hypothetical protein